MTPTFEPERRACESAPVYMTGFNPDVALPYGLTSEIVFKAMNDFTEFLTFVNASLNEKGIIRLENLIMPANFSSLVGEFMIQRIAVHSTTLTKNRYHNGHPDLIPIGLYPEDKAQHEPEGIEIKASRPPIPFKFLKVIGAHLAKSDWLFTGRSETSRRTITASVTDSGRRKMEANWIYCVPELKPKLLS